MLTFLADQNFNANIVRGLLRRLSDVDVFLIQDTPADGAADPDVLRWAAAHSRVLLTHDRKTMPDFARASVAAGEPLPGVVVVDDWMAIGLAIDDLALIAGVMTAAELDGRVIYVPLCDGLPVPQPGNGRHTLSSMARSDRVTFGEFHVSNERIVIGGRHARGRVAVEGQRPPVSPTPFEATEYALPFYAVLSQSDIRDKDEGDYCGGN